GKYLLFGFFYLFLISETGAHTINVNGTFNLSETTEPSNPNANENSQLAEVKVSGTVLDSGGSPIPGVTVSVLGTTIGTATDLNGAYALSVPEGATLVFSFIGFETQNVEVGDRSVIDITLMEDIASLDEV